MVVNIICPISYGPYHMGGTRIPETSGWKEQFEKTSSVTFQLRMYFPTSARISNFSIFDTALLNNTCPHMGHIKTHMIWARSNLAFRRKCFLKFYNVFYKNLIRAS